jgi:hypothetical protein
MLGNPPQPLEKQDALRSALRRGLTISQAARVADMSMSAAARLARRWRANGELLGKTVQIRERAEHARKMLLNGQSKLADSYSINVACGGARPFSASPDERLVALIHLIQPEHAVAALRQMKRRRQTPMQWLANRVEGLATADAMAQSAKAKRVQDNQ